MKRMLRRCGILTGILALALALAVSASAADTQGVQVQLNGEMMTFTDAAPTIQDGRTMIPMRAVFEALGAEVSYDDATRTITAVRGDTTVTMIQDQAQVKVTEAGQDRTVEMDVAPYADAVSGRTYVPVRFAAEALGCMVGWDEANRTALIVDVDALMADAGEYTLLNQLYALSSGEATYQMDGTFTGSIQVTGEDGTMVPAELNGTMNAVASQMAGEMEVKLSLDLDELMESLGTALTDEDKAAMNALKDMSMKVIYDLEQGQMYLNMPFLSQLDSSVSGSENLWFQLNLAGLYTQIGMDWSSMTTLVGNYGDAKAALESLITSMPLNSIYSYTVLAQIVEGYSAHNDAAFQKVGDNYVASTVMADETTGMTAENTMTLYTKDGKVFGYVTAMTMTVDGQEMMRMTASMDEDLSQKVELSMNMEGMLAMEFTMETTQQITEQIPAAQPPEGAVVVDLNDLMGSVDTAVSVPVTTVPETEAAA